MSRLQIETLDTSSPLLFEAALNLLVNAFAEQELQARKHLPSELQTIGGRFYRQFFIARQDSRIVGVSGIKAAEWANATHLLYLSAVAPELRGQGIGRALLQARLEWIEKHFASGRILVVSAKAKRFRDFGFSLVPKSGVDGRFLMMRRFARKNTA